MWTSSSGHYGSGRAECCFGLRCYEVLGCGCMACISVLTTVMLSALPLATCVSVRLVSWYSHCSSIIMFQAQTRRSFYNLTATTCSLLLHLGNWLFFHISGNRSFLQYGDRKCKSRQGLPFPRAVFFFQRGSSGVC